MMKRLMCALLALMLILSSVNALAVENNTGTEEPAANQVVIGSSVIEGEPTHLNVGSMTRVNGAFFTSQFGNNTSDIDVRFMVHGYDVIIWDTQLQYIIDPMVVEDLQTSKDSEGNKIYTFTIADDLYWNDGTQITAADYVFTYLLLTSPEFESISGDTDVWANLVGYEEYADGTSDALSGVRLIDDYHFSLTVKAKYLPFFYEYSMISTYCYPMDVIAPGCTVVDTEDGAMIVNADETVEDPIFTTELLKATVLDANEGYLSHPYKSCGPYSLVSYDASTGIVEFELNTYYKGNHEGAKPSIATVTLYPVKDAEIVAQMENGEIDLVNKVVDGETIDALSATEASVKGQDYPRLGYGNITFACEQGPQQFVAVRQAIACALDVEAFVDEYIKDYGVAAYGYYGIGQWMYLAVYGSLYPRDLSESELAVWESFSLDQLDHYNYDLDRAIALLEEDGWVLNENGEAYDAEVDTLRYKDVDGELMALSFTFGKTEEHKAADMLVEMLQDSFEKMGAELIVVVDNFNSILDDHFTEDGVRKYDMSFLASNFAARFDAMINFEYDEEGPGSQNHFKIMDEELAEATWKMHNTPPGDLIGYMNEWIKFEERFNEVLPTLPLYSNYYYDFFISELQNYHADYETNWPEALLYAYLVEAE